MQNIYGYYVDQKMWTDVTDLFEKDGTFEIVGTGRYIGEQNIRRAFGSIASNGLLHGEVNEHLQLEPLVTVAPGGREAWLRGFQLGMLRAERRRRVVDAGDRRDPLSRSGSGWSLAHPLAAGLSQSCAPTTIGAGPRSQMPEPRPRRAATNPTRPACRCPPPGQAWASRFQLSASGARAEPIAYPAGVIAVGESERRRATAPHRT